METLHVGSSLPLWYEPIGKMCATQVHLYRELLILKRYLQNLSRFHKEEVARVAHVLPIHPCLRTANHPRDQNTGERQLFLFLLFIIFTCDVFGH